jgi:hypothetical protein
MAGRPHGRQSKPRARARVADGAGLEVGVPWKEECVSVLQGPEGAGTRGRHGDAEGAEAVQQADLGLDSRKKHHGNPLAAASDNRRSGWRADACEGRATGSQVPHKAHCVRL